MPLSIRQVYRSAHAPSISKWLVLTPPCSHHSSVLPEGFFFCRHLEAKLNSPHSLALAIAYLMLDLDLFNLEHAQKLCVVHLTAGRCVSQSVSM